MKTHPNTFVYVMTDGHGIKIGVAQNADERRDALQIGNPRLITVSYVSKPLPRLIAYGVERKAHSYFTYYRLAGEWFRINPAHAEKCIEVFISHFGH